MDSFLRCKMGVGVVRFTLLMMLLMSAPAMSADFFYEVNADGTTVTITGCDDPGGSLIIPAMIDGKTVTAIGNYSFQLLTSVTNLSIPSGVSRIGTYAFAMTGLTEVALPDGVLSIGASAFGDCPSLMSVSLPNSISNIEESAFVNCASLTNVAIPSSVISIQPYVFAFCSGLKNVTIPNGVNYIGWWAFRNCYALTNVVIPNSVAEIDDHAFSCCGRLEKLTLGDHVVRLGENAFENCVSLSTLLIPGSVTDIDYNAFKGCGSLQSVLIPASVKVVESGAFSDCSKLVSINVSAANAAYTSVDGVLFTRNERCLVQFPGGRSGSYQVPAGVTAIDLDAFVGCSELVSVNISDNVSYVWYDSFVGCGKLASINVSAANMNYASVDGVLFTKDMLEILCCPGGKTGDYVIPDSVEDLQALVFRGCSRLTSVTIPAAAYIDGWPFFDKCDNLTAINVHSSNTNYRVVDGVLYNRDLTELLKCPEGKTGNITIPASVNKIEGNALRGCHRLTAINVDNENETFESLDGVLFDKGLAVLLQFPGGKGGAYAIPAGTVWLKEFAFYACTNLTSVVVPEFLWAIPPFAFAECTNLERVFFNEAMSIEDFAFYGCDSLEGIYAKKYYYWNVGHNLFDMNSPTVIYYHYLTSGDGWGKKLAGRPTALWIYEEPVPFSESFESEGEMPERWRLEFLEGTADWAYQAGGYAGNPNTAHSGNYNAVLYAPAADRVKTKLVSPMIDLGVHPKSATLSFWHCMQNKSGDIDELRVFYKTTLNTNWTHLATYTDETPEWTQRTLALPDPSRTYFIAFEGTANFGYGVCIDDVEVTVESPTITVTFDPQGGSTPSPQSKSVTFGSAYEALATTLRSGYTFGGWYTNAVCMGAQVTSATTVAIAADHTLYAKWTELATSTTPVPVPYSWLEKYPTLMSMAGGNHEIAAIINLDLDGMLTWQEYVAGSDPTNKASVFLSLIGVNAGQPLINWVPDLGTTRVYTVNGKTNLNDAAWGPTNSGSRFFKVKVGMP